MLRGYGELCVLDMQGTTNVELSVVGHGCSMTRDYSKHDVVGVRQANGNKKKVEEVC